MASHLVNQHQQSSFATPINGAAGDATVVLGNDNATVTTYNSHDADATIHVQDSSAAVFNATPAGTAGRKWMTNDAGAVYLYYDTGSAWVEVNYLRTASTGAVTITSTTAPQLTVRYDGSNYLQVSVSSAGAVTLNATGASAGFTFSDSVTVTTGGLTVSAGTTAVQALTATTGMFSGGAGAASLTIPATGRLMLDGGGNTFIEEASADVVGIVCGGTTRGTFSATGLAVTGGLTATAGTFSGVLTSTASGQLVVRSGASTSAQYIDLGNTSGRMLMGIEGSAATIIAGATAYDTAITGAAGISMSADGGTTKHFRIANTGALTLSAGISATTGTFSGALTYGGVTLSNAVTGTGNMVLSASPTFTGTVQAAAVNCTGTVGAVALQAATVTATGDGELRTLNQSDAAGVATGTLTNAPSAGNPAFWLKVHVNGTLRFIPCW